MSATLTKKHTCSCGRSFANEQILKYHERVSNHGPAEANEAAAAAEPTAPAAAEPAAPIAAPVHHENVAAETAPATPAVVAAAKPLVAKPLVAAAPVVVNEPVIAPLTVEADRAEQAYLAALEILRSKHAEQERLERREVTHQLVGEFVEFAGEMAVEAAQVGKRAVATGLSAAYQVLAKVVMVLIIVLFTVSIFGAGVGLVNLVANSASSAGVANAGAWGSVARI